MDKTWQQELQEILQTMNVPATRTHDMGWLRRNLAIQNSDHVELERAISLIKKLEKRQWEHPSSLPLPGHSPTT